MLRDIDHSSPRMLRCAFSSSPRKYIFQKAFCFTYVKQKIFCSTFVQTYVTDQLEHTVNVFVVVELENNILINTLIVKMADKGLFESANISVWIDFKCY